MKALYALLVYMGTKIEISASPIYVCITITEPLQSIAIYSTCIYIGRSSILMQCIYTTLV